MPLQNASLKASIDKMKEQLQKYLYDCDETEAQVEQLKGRIESCDQEVRDAARLMHLCWLHRCCDQEVRDVQAFLAAPRAWCTRAMNATVRNRSGIQTPFETTDGHAQREGYLATVSVMIHCHAVSLLVRRTALKLFIHRVNNRDMHPCLQQGSVSTVAVSTREPSSELLRRCWMDILGLGRCGAG